MNLLTTARQDINIQDWNNCKNLDVFVDKFKLAQNLEAKIDQFTENFLRSKLVSDEDLLEMEGINWLLDKVSKFDRDSKYYLTVFDVFNYGEIYESKEDKKLFKKYRENKKYQIRLAHEGWRGYSHDEIFKYEIPEGIFIGERGEELLRNLSRLRYESPQQIRFVRKLPDLTREINESLRDEQEFFRKQYREFFKGRRRKNKDYFILDELGQPLPVTNEIGFKYMKMEMTDDVLHCYIPALGKFIYGYSPLVFDPKGLVVHLEFDVYTNSLINYETATRNYFNA